ncbi:MAG: flagellar protein FlaG [Gammaproteobacteria bacterium]|nr:flagellar protein FlaG [Gammaproteobacteria bacterium]
MDIRHQYPSEPQQTTASTSVSQPVSKESVRGTFQGVKEAEQISDTPAVKEVPAGKEGVKPQELGNAVRDLNDYVQVIKRNLQFNIDRDSGHTVVKVVDAETEETIRQIPSEEVLEMARHLVDSMDQPGLIFQMKA